jgi:hypothetical protein
MKRLPVILLLLLTLSGCFKQKFGCKCFVVGSAPNQFTLTDIGKRTEPSAKKACQDIENEMNKSNAGAPVVCETGIWEQ